MVGAGRINAYQAVSLAQSYHNADDTITSNVIWSTNSYRGGNVVIDSLATLTITGTLHCTPSARIIVRPGGKLIVNGDPWPKSPTPDFLSLRRQYEELSDSFERNGYADVLEHRADNAYDAATVAAAENAARRLDAVARHCWRRMCCVSSSGSVTMTTRNCGRWSKTCPIPRRTRTQARPGI